MGRASTVPKGVAAVMGRAKEGGAAQDDAGFRLGAVVVGWRIAEA